MVTIDNTSPNAAIKFARWLATHPIRQSITVGPRRPAWIGKTRPRVKALIETVRPV
ncbi:MAG TPA: hypothetical protein VGD88_05110 [Opitutaceae bacterium]